MAKHKMALFGCGNMGSAHVNRFSGLEERVEITAAVDIDKERAEKTAEKFANAKALTDYREAFDLCDSVLIALPHHLHHEAGLACFEAGKHVLMEKPLANSEQECLDLIAASQSSDKTLMVAYCMRFHPMLLKLKEVADSGDYGTPFHLSIWTEQHTEREPESWMCRRDTLGGGQLFSHGCHYIDLMLWYMGHPVRGTHLGTNFGTPWMEREGTSNVAVEFESGALGYHFGTWGAKGTRLGYSFHLHCTGGMIECHITDGKMYAHTPDGTKELMEEKHAKNLPEETLHFFDCVESGATPRTSAPESIQGLRVIWRMYEAEDNDTVADLRGLGLDQVSEDGSLTS